MPVTIQRAQFRGMGSAVEIEIVGGAPGHLALARDRMAFLESCWSRFRLYSDISRLNDAQGEPVTVNPATIQLLEAMEAGYTATDGAFDPTLLAPLVDGDTRRAGTTPRPARGCRKACNPTVSSGASPSIVNGSQAQLPPGTAVDAGGIGKGLAADMVAEMLLDDGVVGAKVSVGGDVRVVGRGSVRRWLDGGDRRRIPARAGGPGGALAEGGLCQHQPSASDMDHERWRQRPPCARPHHP